MASPRDCPTVELNRRRVLDSRGHRRPDAIPVDFGGTAQTGTHVIVVAARFDAVREFNSR